MESNQLMDMSNVIGMTRIMNTIASPCVRNCCLDNNDICIGCYRHIDEIVGWVERSDEEKLIIQTNTETRKITAEQNKRQK